MSRRGVVRFLVQFVVGIVVGILVVLALDACPATAQPRETASEYR